MASQKRLFIDQTNRQVEIAAPQSRIISVVPSQTELLYDLGLENEVVGITKFCIHPNEWFKSKTRIGGTKTIDIDKIKALHPDLIIANKEENDQSQIEELSTLIPVWISDIKTLPDALVMIEQVGSLTNKMDKAKEIVSAIQLAFDAFTAQKSTDKKKCAYFIWWHPLMTVNQDTFINDMLQLCGWENVFAERMDSRYPEITDEQLIAANPEIVLLSSEPFPFAAKHIAHFQNLLPNAQVLLVDGEMFSWYGSRLMQAANYMDELVRKVNAL